VVGTIELTSVLILPPSGSFAIHDDDLLKEEIIYFSFEKLAVRFGKKEEKLAVRREYPWYIPCSPVVR